MEALIEESNSTPAAPGTAEIFVPGEPEARTAERLRPEGITVVEPTWASSAKIADDTGVPPAVPRFPAVRQEHPA